eukprot:365862-Chlamydomonas_euryale.AAC.8
MRARGRKGIGAPFGLEGIRASWCAALPWTRLRLRSKEPGSRPVMYGRVMQDPGSRVSSKSCRFCPASSASDAACLRTALA